MPYCEKCARLIGKPPSLGPHASLKQLSGRKTSNCLHEYYACDVCGTTLKRVVPFPGFEGRIGEPWSERRKGESGKLTERRQHVVTGTYTPNRDNSHIYTYEATWIVSNARVIWDSEVKRGGDWKANPGGHFAFSTGLDVPRTIIRLVGAAIEDLVEVKP